MRKMSKKGLIITGVSSLSVIGLVIILLLLFYFGIFSGLSTVKFDKNKLINVNTSLEVYDNNDKIIEENYSGDRPTINIEKIPKHVINAFISIEDKDFYKHRGINVKRMIKAFFVNIKAGKVKQGASTISQQLIKNTHLSNKKTFSRKMNEILLAQTLEKKFSKSDILENYLNVIYFGSGTFGIEQASQKYFGKTAEELTIDEGAMLAGIIKAPSRYSPILAQENCKNRRNIVLNEMKEEKYITQEEFAYYSTLPISIKEDISLVGQNDYLFASIDEACSLLQKSEKELTLNGYKIFTYMDKDEQTKAEQLLQNKDLYPKNNPDAMILSIKTQNGAISAYKSKSKYNLLKTTRQPGSIIKPIISYGPAIEYGTITPQSPILDEKCTFNGYSPNNYKDTYHGYVTAKQALSQSLNIPSVKVLDLVGIERAKFFASKLGISLNKTDNGYAIALGGLTEGITPLEITNAYLPFANNGKYIKASFIRKIEDKNGNTIYSNTKTPYEVINEDTAFLITDMLKETVVGGTAKKLQSLNNENIASKTGTVGDKNGNTDIWNISYTPEKVCCVLMCNTKEREYNFDNNTTGSGFPTIMMREFLKGTKNKSFIVPNTIRKQKIDILNLNENAKLTLATQSTPERYIKEEYFSIRNLPKQDSTIFEQIDNFTINITVKQSAEISFNAKGYLTYEIYRKNDDMVDLLKTIEGFSGKVSFEDKDIKHGNFYQYYVIAKMEKSSTKSNVVKIAF